MLWIVTSTFSCDIFKSLEYIPRLDLLGHMRTLMFNFLRNCQTIPELLYHFHQQCLSIPVSPYPHQQLSLSIFLIIVTLGWSRYFIVAFIFISPMTNDVKYLFMSSFANFFDEMSIQIISFYSSCFLSWYVCIWCKIKLKIHFSLYKYSTVSATFVEKTVI